MVKNLVVFAHGLSESSPDYAGAFIQRVKERLPAKLDVDFVQLYYEPIFATAENTLFKKLESEPMWHNEHFKGLRLPIMSFVMDALQTGNADIRQEILTYIITTLKPYNLYEVNLHLMCHSWGTVIALGDKACFSSRVIEGAKSITTYGAALQYIADPGLVFSSAVQAKWTNFWHSMDIVGMPLNAVFGCQDVEVKDAGPPTEIVGDEGILLTGEAHNAYYQSEALVKHLAQRIFENA
jgi:hypothetical protein